MDEKDRTLATGFALFRGSTMLLDNLGISLDLTAIYRATAARLGRESIWDLSDLERFAATLEAYQSLRRLS